MDGWVDVDSALQIWIWFQLKSTLCTAFQLLFENTRAAVSDPEEILLSHTFLIADTQRLPEGNKIQSK